MSAANRCNGMKVKTTWGEATLLGYDGKGLACVALHYGQAPELEPKFPDEYKGERGPFYVVMIPESDIEREA